jgi:predicted Zn-dependent peptidase
MDTLTDLARAPQMLQHEGTEYALVPLRLMDLGLLSAWIKQQIVAQAKELLAELGADAPADIKQQVWQDAIKACKEPLSSELTSTPAGLLEMCFLSLRRSSPNITKEKVAAIIQSYTVQDIANWVRTTLLGGTASVSEDTAKNV